MIDYGDNNSLAARMMALNGLSPKRIAEALNVPEQDVRQWLKPSGDDPQNAADRGWPEQ